MAMFSETTLTKEVILLAYHQEVGLMSWSSLNKLGSNVILVILPENILTLL